MEIIEIIVKTLFAYIFLILVIRLMGKREVGNLSVFDLAVYFIISDLITMSLVDKNNEVWLPIVSVAFLAIIQILLSKITLKNKKIRDFIDGKMSLIINDGVIDFNEMKKQRYTVDDLFTQLREKGIDTPSVVRWALLETSGKLSVILHTTSKTNFPDPLISDGKVSFENLKAVNKTENWLYNKLQKQNINTIKDVKIALLMSNDELFIILNH